MRQPVKDVLVTQSCLTLCDSMDWGSQAHALYPWNYPGKNTLYPFPSPGDLLNSGIDPGSPELQEDSLPSEPPGKLC